MMSGAKAKTELRRYYIEDVRSLKPGGRERLTQKTLLCTLTDAGRRLEGAPSTGGKNHAWFRSLVKQGASKARGIFERRKEATGKGTGKAEKCEEPASPCNL